jgi:hypothetical protein
MDRAPLSETLTSSKPSVRFGLAKGLIWIADDFDDSLPDDLLKSFYGLALDEDWPELTLQESSPPA